MEGKVKRIVSGKAHPWRDKRAGITHQTLTTIINASLLCITPHLSKVSNSRPIVIIIRTLQTCELGKEDALPPVYQGQNLGMRMMELH